MATISTNLSPNKLKEQAFIHEEHIPQLLEALVRISDKWELIGIVLGLPRHITKKCTHKSNVVALDNVLCEWVCGGYTSAIPATLQNLKEKLASEMIGEGCIAQKIVPDILEPKIIVTDKNESDVSSNRVFSNMDNLKRIYSVWKDIPRDSWPPVGTTTFINLVLINETGELTLDYDNYVLGNIDDVIKGKKTVEYSEVFGKFLNGGLILVEGRPCSGKTTLVHKVAKDWATGKEVLVGADMVFLIPLRAIQSKKGEHTLLTLLSLFYWDKSELISVAKDINKKYGKGICFILDGLDEYELQVEDDNSIVHPLISKTVLPHAMVIVVSRPLATADLKKDFQFAKHVEVIGFDTSNIYKYIDQYPFVTINNYDAPSKKCGQLKEYLEIHPNILHMCYVPVHVAMICFLYQHKNRIPHTETGIYEEFTTLIILRSLKRSNKTVHFNSIEQLQAEPKLWFRNICKLAFNMTIQNRQVIDQKDTDVTITSDLVSGFNPSLGLVTIDQTVSELGFANTYTFLHLTLQEYLAAVHMSGLEIIDQVKLINQYGNESFMGNVLVFYCGMTQFTMDDTRLAPIGSSPYKMRCAFESQQSIVCDAVLGSESKRNTVYTQRDIMAFAFILQRATHSPTELTFVCGITIANLKELFEILDKNPLKSIQKVTFKSNHLGSEMVPVLLHGLRSCERLVSLELSWNELGLDGITTLVYGLNAMYVNLEKLNLWGNNINDEAAMLLLEDLNCCQCIRCLNLGFNGIRGDVFGALKYWSSLEKLVLSNNYGLNIGSLVAGLCSLSTSLCEGGSQEVATVITSDFNESYSTKDSIRVISTLEVLGLRGCGIDISSIKQLLEVFKNCVKLHELDISENFFDREGLSYLCHGLAQCDTLECLKLRDCNIGNDGAMILSEWLTSSFNSIKSLDILNDNKLSSEGKEALLSAAAIKCITVV